jgi:hypothetical protein
LIVSTVLGLFLIHLISNLNKNIDNPRKNKEVTVYPILYAEKLENSISIIFGKPIRKLKLNIEAIGIKITPKIFLIILQIY